MKEKCKIYSFHRRNKKGIWEYFIGLPGFDIPKVFSLKLLLIFAIVFRWSVWAKYLEMVFNFSQGILRSSFITTICLGDILTGRRLPIFRMFNLVSLSNYFTDLPDTALLKLPEMVDKYCFNALFLQLMVLLHTTELSLIHFDTLVNVVG